MSTDARATHRIKSIVIDEESLGPDAADAFLTEQGMADPAERALVAEYCAALRDGLDPLITLLDRGFAGANIP